jgi:DNA-binding transcriptional MerR regulator
VGPVTTELGIREVSEQTGLTIDTLRWYEKEGLIPLVTRTGTGQRRYPPGAVRFVRLVQALRRTGMPVADVRAFVQLGAGELRHHAERLALLERQSELIDAQLGQLQADRQVVRDKIEQYRRLIAAGLDCEDADAERAALAQV